MLLKAGVGRFLLRAIQQKFIVTFQHFVIQLVWKNTGLLHLSLALCSDFRKWRPWRILFGQSQVISERACSYWLLYTALLSDRWCCYKLKLISGNNSVCRKHRLPARVELRRTSLNAATFPATVLFCCQSLVQTGLKKESDSKWNKTRARAKTERGGCGGVRSLGVSCHSWLDIQMLPSPAL